MRRILLQITLASVLGVALMLTPLLLMPMRISVEGAESAEPYAQRGLEDVKKLKVEAPITGVDWLKPILTVISGAIAAVAALIVVKRGLKQIK